MQQGTSRLKWRVMCSFPDSSSEPVGDRAVNMFPLLSWDKTLRAAHGTAHKQRKEGGKKGIEWNSEILCFRDLRSITWMSHHVTWTCGTSSDRLVRGSPSVTQSSSSSGAAHVPLWDTRQPSFPSRMGSSKVRYLQPRCPHLGRLLWALSDSD